MSALVEASRADLLFALSLAVLLLGTALCALAWRRPKLDVLAAAAAAGGAVAWLLCNTPGEGPTLLRVLPGNGLTAADLLVVPAALAVPVLALRRALRADDGG